MSRGSSKGKTRKRKKHIASHPSNPIWYSHRIHHIFRLSKLVGCYPQAVESFLATTSTTKKIIYPFCTHEGSSFGHSLDQLRKACPEAMIKTGLAIRGSRVSKADQTIDNWLKYVYFQ
ncbi:hypothetical protein CUM72_04955 [Enterococcus durans]|nr:hypothetical protein CUM72_04955 [Enterococcus durans]